MGVKGAEDGAYLLCWGQDRLGLEGTGGSRDAAHDEAAVDASGRAMVFRTGGACGRGGGVARVVLRGFSIMQGFRIMQALQPGACAPGAPGGASVQNAPWKREQVVEGGRGVGRVRLRAGCEEGVQQADYLGGPLFANRKGYGLADARRGGWRWRMSCGKGGSGSGARGCRVRRGGCCCGPRCRSRPACLSGVQDLGCECWGPARTSACRSCCRGCQGR